jgi:UDP-3-O-[3-hydroxymyristoyl] glucosamine N-acyltransferase
MNRKELDMSIRLIQIARLLDGKIVGDPECVITGAGPLAYAVEGQITFAEKGIALKHIAECRASAVIVPKGFSDSAINVIQVDNPRVAFAKVLNHFNPVTAPRPGISPKAVIGKHCTLGKGIAVAAGVVVGDHVTLGDSVVLHPNCVIGDHVSIGNETVIYPNVSLLERCVVGARVIIHAGSVIGSDGFGFVFDNGRHRKIPQIGIVRIDDDVEIGANNTIDRATMGETWIKTGVKTDNQVHIAHNVVMGEHSVITAQVGIAGSTTIGHHAVIAGQAGIGGHLTIGDQVTIGPQGAVAQSVPDKQIVSSTTLAMPHRTWLRLQQVLPQLPDMKKKMAELERQLTQLINDTPETS